MGGLNLTGAVNGYINARRAGVEDRDRERQALQRDNFKRNMDKAYDNAHLPVDATPADGVGPIRRKFDNKTYMEGADQAAMQTGDPNAIAAMSQMRSSKTKENLDQLTVMQEGLYAAARLARAGDWEGATDVFNMSGRDRVKSLKKHPTKPGFGIVETMDGEKHELSIDETIALSKKGSTPKQDHGVLKNRQGQTATLDQLKGMYVAEYPKPDAMDFEGQKKFSERPTFAEYTAKLGFQIGEQPGANPYPEGSKIRDKQGVEYVVKNGKPVPVNGSPAKNGGQRAQGIRTPYQAPKVVDRVAGLRPREEVEAERQRLKDESNVGPRIQQGIEKGRADLENFSAGVRGPMGMGTDQNENMAIAKQGQMAANQFTSDLKNGILPDVEVIITALPYLRGEDAADAERLLRNKFEG